MYSGYEITFDSADSWSFNIMAMLEMLSCLVLILISSSSHADNRKNNFLVLRSGLTSGINGSFG